MATADQVKALVRSRRRRRESLLFRGVAGRRKGGTQRADQVRNRVTRDDRSSELDAGKTGRTMRPVPATQLRGELAGLLAVSYPDLRLSDLTVEPSVRDRLERVLTEQRQAERLRQHGFAPMHRLLLVGSPGTGKTMTAGVPLASCGCRCS